MKEAGAGPSKLPRVDVVIPVLNEAHVLAESVATVRAFLETCPEARWRVAVVDNGSTDGTREVARRLEEAHDDVDFYHLDEAGRGRALRYAWRKSDADVVCYMDVDLSTDLGALPELVAAVTAEGYDVAVGSRLLPESETVRSRKREVISRVYNGILKLVLRTSFSDAQCGFKAVSREVVERLVPQVRDDSWFFDTELLVLAERQGYRIKDMAVVWVEDDDSRVKILRTGWEDLKGVFRLRRKFWRDGLRARLGSVSADSASASRLESTESPPA